jgi:hypothetical protein
VLPLSAFVTVRLFCINFIFILVIIFFSWASCFILNLFFYLFVFFLSLLVFVVCLLRIVSRMLVRLD